MIVPCKYVSFSYGPPSEGFISFGTTNRPVTPDYLLLEGSLTTLTFTETSDNPNFVVTEFAFVDSYWVVCLVTKLLYDANNETASS